jgi:hypothetical protein
MPKYGRGKTTSQAGADRPHRLVRWNVSLKRAFAPRALLIRRVPSGTGGRCSSVSATNLDTPFLSCSLQIFACSVQSALTSDCRPPFELHRTHIADRRVSALGIVEAPISAFPAECANSIASARWPMIATRGLSEPARHGGRRIQGINHFFHRSSVRTWHDIAKARRSLSDLPVSMP